MNRRAPLIAAALAALMALLVFAFLLFPTFGQIGEAEQDLERARAEHASLEAELSRLQAVAEDLPRLQRQLARFRRAVPEAADLPGLINLLQSAADVAAVDFFSISPSQPTASPAGQAAVIPAQIQVVGTFFPVDEFLFRLETLRRAAKVTGIAVTEGPVGFPQIDVVLQVSFFTTDTAAGPGSPVEAPTEGVSPAPGPEASPEGSPGASPSPTATAGG